MWNCLPFLCRIVFGISWIYPEVIAVSVVYPLTELRTLACLISWLGENGTVNISCTHSWWNHGWLPPWDQFRKGHVDFNRNSHNCYNCALRVSTLIRCVPRHLHHYVVNNFCPKCILHVAFKNSSGHKAWPFCAVGEVTNSMDFGGGRCWISAFIFSGRLTNFSANVGTVSSNPWAMVFREHSKFNDALCRPIWKISPHRATDKKTQCYLRNAPRKQDKSSEEHLPPPNWKLTNPLEKA